MDRDRLNTGSRTGMDRKPLAFFVGFLREPQQVGSVVPSSRFLERRIIEAAELADARLVVEFGPGTGGTTRAILERLRPEARLLTIEMSRHFARVIDAIGDPRLISHTGSAEHLAEILEHYGLDKPDVAISGIPFSTMPPSTGRAIVQAIHESLAGGGRFVAYQVTRRVAEIATPIMGPPAASMVIRNIPPMRVFRWRKPA